MHSFVISYVIIANTFTMIIFLLLDVYIDSQILGCTLRGKQVILPPTYLACAGKYLKMKTKDLLTKYMRLLVL